MGRLAGRGNVSRIGKPASRLKAGRREVPKAEGQRHAWHNWYYLARWRRLRWSVLEAADFTCAWCGRIEADTSKLVADHVQAHRGNPDLFWDRGNLQCLCKPCHDREKQRQEQQGWGG